jgi:hypothetical protein
VAVDSGGDVFVVENNGVFLLTFGWGVQDGVATLETCTSGCQDGIKGSGAGQIYGGGGASVDGNGNVFASETRFNTVQKCSGSGAFLTK